MFIFLSWNLWGEDVFTFDREVIYGKRVTWKSRGYFFHENPPNPIGDTQKYQKKLNFWSKTCFLWVFLELLKCYCYKLRKYTNFISSPIQSIFVQFLLKRTHLKGKDVYFLAIMASKGWGQRKKHDGLQNLELEGQISQNVSPQIFFFRKQKKPCCWLSEMRRCRVTLKKLQTTAAASN